MGVEAGPDGPGVDGVALACPGDGEFRRLTLLDAAGNRPPPGRFEIGTATVSFTATVTIVESCEAADCGGAFSGFRIGLAEANGTTWSLLVAFPGVPLDVSAGDVLEITSKGETRSNSLYFVTEHGTLVRRNGELVMFEDIGQQLFQTAGITIELSDVRCQHRDFTASGLRVGFEGETALAMPGQAVQVGSLQFTYDPSPPAVIGMIPVSSVYRGVRLPR